MHWGHHSFGFWCSESICWLPIISIYDDNISNMVVGFNSHITTIGNFRHGVRFYQSDFDACSDEVVGDTVLWQIMRKLNLLQLLTQVLAVWVDIEFSTHGFTNTYSRKWRKNKKQDNSCSHSLRWLIPLGKISTVHPFFFQLFQKYTILFFFFCCNPPKVTFFLLFHFRLESVITLLMSLGKIVHFNRTAQNDVVYNFNWRKKRKRQSGPEKSKPEQPLFIHEWPTTTLHEEPTNSCHSFCNFHPFSSTNYTWVSKLLLNQRFRGIEESCEPFRNLET